jgi:hypothetical protein
MKFWNSKRMENYEFIFYYTQRRAKSIRSLIFYYIFHIKPHFLKTLFQSRLFFDFDDFFYQQKQD